MQKYFGTTIAKLLPRINRDIYIPSIQRPYVWEAEQVVKLFDSLMRGYPINTFLLWELEAEHFGDWEIYRFVHDFRHGDIHNDPAAVTADKPVTLVLDGQQRLTSLLIGLAGSYTTRNGKKGRGAGWIAKILYLDLLQSPDVSESDEDGLTVRELYYGFKFVAAERPPKNDEESVWFKIQHIVDVPERDQLEAMIDRLLLSNPNLSETAQFLLRKNLTRLWEVVHQEECIAYYLEREQSYDKVLDIFVRANDGGTKLSRSDLLMSMVTLRWDQFNARSETEAVTYAMRETLSHESAFDRDYLLRAGLFFNDLDFAFQLRNFTPRNIAVIESRWPAVKKALLLAADLFRRFGITGGALTGVNAVMLIGCYLFKLNAGNAVGEWNVGADDDDRIRRWIGAVLFHNVLSGAANVTMEFYRRVLNEQLRNRQVFPVEELANRMTVRGRSMVFDDTAVGRFVAQDTKSRIFGVTLSLLYSRADWTVRDWQHVQVIPSHLLLDDRLRVQGVAEDNFPSIRAWAHALVNYIILSDDEAKEYYSVDLEQWIATRTAEFWRRHHLPDDPALYEEFNFLDFVQARKNLLKPYLQRLLQTGAAAKTSCVGEDTSEDESTNALGSL